MRLLVLGGSWLLGRLVVAVALARGFEVTVFNQGRSGDALAPGARHVKGNRKLDADLTRLAGSGPWDAVVDISGKVPSVVGSAVRALAPAAARYVSVSTVLAYQHWPAAPVDEDSALWECAEISTRGPGRGRRRYTAA